MDWVYAQQSSYSRLSSSSCIPQGANQDGLGVRSAILLFPSLFFLLHPPRSESRWTGCTLSNPLIPVSLLPPASPKERIKMDWVYAQQSSYSRLSSSSCIPQGANQDGLGVRSVILLFPSLFFLLLLHPPRSESRWTGCTLSNPLIPVSLLPPPPTSPKERIKMDWVYAQQSSYSRLSSSSSYIPQGANQDGLGVRSAILLFPSLFFLLLLHPPRSESRWTGCTLSNPLIPVSLLPPASPKERIKMDWVYAQQSSYSRLSSSSCIPQGANQDGLGVRSVILLFPSLFFLLLLHPPRSESRWTGCTLSNPLIPVSLLPPPPTSPKERIKMDWVYAQQSSYSRLSSSSSYIPQGANQDGLGVRSAILLFPSLFFLLLHPPRSESRWTGCTLSNPLIPVSLLPPPPTSPKE